MGAEQIQAKEALMSAKAEGRRLTTCSIITFLFAVLCLLPSTDTLSLTVGLLPRALAQNESPVSAPSPLPSPSPSPSPTPPPNLHQWGAVTLFHGLPSDRVHAIAQTPDGVMWFATDGGLARYDGQRRPAITAEGLPPGRVLALKLDQDGTLWIGTDIGAARLSAGKFEALKETSGKVITAIITPAPGRALLASESGVVFDYQLKPGGGLTSRAIPDQPLQSADKDHPGLLKITSLALVGNTLYAGSQSRGLFTIEDGQAKEVQSKPRNFFINALETDAKGHLLFGARARSEDSGFFDSTDPLKPNKSKTPSGTVMTITRGADDEIWTGSDGRGAFRFKDGKTERF